MNPMPASLMQRATQSAVRSILTPNAAKTSAAPEREERARLPCFATGTPAPATINAAQVEILNEPEASPPVPTTSTASAGGWARNNFLCLSGNAPGVSLNLSSPRGRGLNKPPTFDGGGSPEVMVLAEPGASS